MYLRPKTRIQLYQILVITFFWVLGGAFFAIYKCVTYDLVSGEFIFVVPQGKTLTSFVLTNMIGPFIGGLVGGGILILFLNDRLRTKSYISFLLISACFFFVIIFLLNTGVSYFSYYKDEIAASVNPLSTAVKYLLDPYAIRNIATWMIIALLTLFAVRVYEKYGPQTFLGLMRGAYHRAHEVERVFMFLDLTASTTIAEKIGHVRFFNLLRDFYADITDPILNSRGEIHQYIGDEIIIAWPTKKAVSDNVLHCIDCFGRIEMAIQAKAHYYQQRYGAEITFKAALHKGKVVIGEMGVIKREIVYSGDTLNTAARMLEQCKKYKQRLITSQEVLDMIPASLQSKVSVQLLGEMLLRGKVRSMKLYGVDV